MWTLDQEIRRRYVHGMTRLGVWYVRLLLERGEIRSEELPLVLSKRVDLYRFTDLWNGTNESADGTADGEWIELATQISVWVRETPIEDTDRLEQRVLSYLEPTILRRRVGMPQRPSRDGVLHVMNVMAPGSLFEDMPRLAQSLQGLIAHLRLEHAQVQELWCNTWLNEHPRFHKLFPDVWFRNATVAALGNYRNWWGQFARRDGDFNATAAQQFRASGGVFPFRALQCHASLDEIESHLRSSFDLYS